MRKFFSALLEKLKPKSSHSISNRFEEYIATFPDENIEKEVLPLLPSLPYAEAQRVIKLLEETGFIDKHIALLMTGSLDKKLKAIAILELLKVKKGLEAMVEAMKDPREEIKWAITEALKRSQNPVVIPRLVQALNYPNHWLPSRIAEICLAFEEKAIPFLLKELKSASEEAKPFIIGILGELKSVEALGEIKRSFTKSSNPEIRQKSIEALGKIGSPEGKEAVIKALEIQDNRIKMAAIQALAGLGQKEDGQYILHYICSEEWLMRVKVSQTLTSLGWKLNKQHLEIIQDKRNNLIQLQQILAQIKEFNKVS